jgi:hypothetical protein
MTSQYGHTGDCHKLWVRVLSLKIQVETTTNTYTGSQLEESSSQSKQTTVKGKQEKREFHMLALNPQNFAHFSCFPATQANF